MFGKPPPAAGYELLRWAVSSKVGDLVGELSEPKCRTLPSLLFQDTFYFSLPLLDEKLLELVDNPSSLVKFTVEPHTPVKLSATPLAVTDIHQLMTSIMKGLSQKDGKEQDVFQECGKNTIAFKLSVPVEDELVIPTCKTFKNRPTLLVAVDSVLAMA